jgi:hypothetical protein
MATLVLHKFLPCQDLPLHSPIVCLNFTREIYTSAPYTLRHETLEPRATAFVIAEAS